MTPEEKFERALAIFRREVEGGIQLLYANLAIHDAAAGPDVRDAINRTPLFWLTTLAALQSSMFVTLGRIFDTNSAHNVGALLEFAKANPAIFSKASLGKRKQGSAATAPKWLADYLKDAHVPTTSDFSRLLRQVADRRAAYDQRYKRLRNKLFAHRELGDEAVIAALFGDTNIRELQRIFVYLSALHEALWDLFHNGRKPTIRHGRYSVRSMRDRPSPMSTNLSIQEKIVAETNAALRSLVR